jgi:transcriptional regulator with XRE-family HTH domain
MKEKYHINLAEVGERLRAVRRYLRLTMEQMRDITGYSKSLISAAEKGKKKPSTIYLFAILDKFSVNINYIFNGKGPMFLEPGEEKNVSISFLELKKNIRELFYLMENVDMVRYAVLSFFLKYKIENKRIIDELLEQKLNEKVKK